jgi:methyl-accepting chemotaxis protein
VSEVGQILGIFNNVSENVASIAGEVEGQATTTQEIGLLVIWCGFDI